MDARSAPRIPLSAGFRAGCFALCTATALAQQPEPPPATQTAIDAAIAKGTSYLLGVYAARLEGGSGDVQEQLGQRALSLYTLLKGGVPKDDPVVRALVSQILGQPIDRTYDAACALLALDAHDPIENHRWIEDLARKLVGWQLEGGDWSYPSGNQDLSNTQYAALGLWVAARGGVEIDDLVWAKLAEAVLRYQGAGGGFSYSPTSGRRLPGSGSMTAAGVGTLAICEMQLRAGRGIPAELEERLAKSRSRGLAWLVKNFSVATNPGGGAWHYYYLYGLERMGAATGVAQIGEHDWYGDGAALLISQQAAQGEWQGARLTDTCFAILFLKRATALRRVPVTGVQELPWDSDRAVRITSQGSGPVRVWIDRWNPKLVRNLEWPGERTRGPRVVRVEYFADDKLVDVQLGDATRGSMNERFGTSCSFTKSGRHTLRARVFILEPGAGPSVLRDLESQVLEVDVERSLPSWLPELARDHGPNLASGSKLAVKASSHASGKEAPLGLDCSPGRLVDGLGATAWLADEEDEQPTVTISLQPAPECNLIRISPAVLPALGSSYLSRPIEIEVRINGKEPHRLSMDPDPLHPISLELERSIGIRRLELRILSSAPSSTCPLVGIGEVELFRTDE